MGVGKISDTVWEMASGSRHGSRDGTSPQCTWVRVVTSHVLLGLSCFSAWGRLGSQSTESLEELVYQSSLFIKTISVQCTWLDAAKAIKTVSLPKKSKG